MSGGLAASLSTLGRHIRDRVSSPETTSMLRALITEQALATYMRKNLANQEDMQALALQSQLHPNGFLKIPILSSGLTKLVIHEWFDTARADSDLHSHRWNFVSAVLRGSLHATDFSSQSSPNGEFSEYSYISTTGQPEINLRAVGRANLVPVRTHCYHAGEVYSQDSAVIHDAGSAAPGTVTLIVQAPATSFECRVFRPVGAELRDPEVVRPDALKVRYTLASVSNILEGLADR